MTLAGLLAPYARRAEQDAGRWLVEPETPPELGDAMRYCVLGGGKRLRPALVYMTAEAIGPPADDELTRRSAVAVELVHCYSLVHDDLPAMDDDTLRRGRPTAHVQFGEAMAILAGDALLTRAFGVLAQSDNPAAARLVAELAAGAGPVGMIAGQVADMNLCDVGRGVEALRYVHQRKTGALIRSAARMGAICARADASQLSAVSRYAEAMGLAFQVIDDLLDVVGQAEDIGKTPGKDAQANKRTYVSELGIDATRSLATELTAAARDALKCLHEPAEPLRLLAELLAGRTS